MKILLLPQVPAHLRSSWVRLLKRLVALIALACVPIPLAGGQGKAAVKGTLEDSTGAAVPGVGVKLRNVPSGQETHTSTDEDGYFEFAVVPPGKYVLDISAQGFKEVTQPLEIGTTPLRPLRIRLELSLMKQQVTVTSKAELAPMAHENPNSVELDQTSLHNLPVPDGDPLAIPSLFLNPASTGAQGPQLVVDGMETSSLDIPTASIREVAVDNNPYSAEFGRPGKGRIEVTTRRGSHHRYRGLVSALVRNSALDARDPFATTVPELQRGIIEAQLSGPISRHVSFFAAGRYYTNNQARVINAVTPEGPLVDNFLSPERNDHAFGRLDYNRHGHQLSVQYKFKYKSRRDQGVGAFNLPSSATNFFNQENEVRVLDLETLSDHLINQARLSFKREPQGLEGVTDSPAIVVPGAFTSGAQISQRLRETSYTVEDIVSYSNGKHTLRFGGQVKPRWFDVFNASNFGGTFYFSGLDAYKAGTPLLFTMNVGNPYATFTQNEYFSFIQDEIRVRDHVSLMLGVRNEFQSNVDDDANFAPRAALAYAPHGGRTVIRAGAGVFYDRQPFIVQEQALLFNGHNITQLEIPNPSFPSPWGSTISLSSLEPNVTRVAPGIQLPYLIQENVSIEHQFGTGRNLLTLDFTRLHGLKLYRMRNINAPLPGTSLRPNPDLNDIFQFESSGMSLSNSATVTYQTTWRRRIDLTAQYVLSKSLDDTPGIVPSPTTGLLFFPVNQEELFPANSYDLRGEWARSDFDRRHRFNLTLFYRVGRGFKTGAVVSLYSGLPFNITTGKDNNHDDVLNDRPPGVGRNTGHGPGYADADLHLGKEFRVFQVSETARMEFGIDAFNLLNHVNFKNYVGTASSRFFGQANAAMPARTLQMSFRFKF